MSATVAGEHTCHGAIFCGQPRAAAEHECPACQPARPLLEVLQEHTDRMRAQREAAKLEYRDVLTRDHTDRHDGAMDTTTDTLLTRTADEALEQATDYGTRTWIRGVPRTENDLGGYDFHASGGITVRLTQDDNRLLLHVFTGGPAMLLKEDASFSAGLAHLAAAYIAEVLR